MATTDPIGLYALSYYLQRIRNFLESEKKTLSFPHISPELQKVLERIVIENTKFIHDDPQFDNIAKLEAAKLTAAMEALENVKLVQEFQDGKHGQNVLVFKKTEKISTKPLGPVANSSDPLLGKNIDLTRDPLVTTSFKLHCLNATVKFVKDDSQLVMKYPQMEPCQAEFILNMLMKGKEGKLEQSEVGFGYRSMYAPLWESMKLFSLKYDYTIEYLPGINPAMKRVIFEKIPKDKETPKMDIDECNKLNTSLSSHSSSATSTSTSSKPKAAKIGKKPQTIKKTVKLVQKMEGFIRGGYIDMEFMSHALQRVNDFMFDQQQASIIFQQVDHNHQYFLEHIEVLAKNEMSYMLFDSECQRYLSSIQYGFSKNIFYETRLGKKINSKKNPLKDVIFEKTVRFPTKETPIKETQGNEENISNNILDDPVQTNSKKLSEIEQKKLLKLKTVKDDVTRSSGGNYILNRLTEISQFLSEDTTKESLIFKRTNQEQALFLKYVHIFSKFDEAYALFSNECQDLLRCIKMNAMKYKMRFLGEIDENDKLINVTIKKKLIEVKSQEKNVSNITSGTHVSLRDFKCQKLDEQDYNAKLKLNGPVMKRSSSLNSVRRSSRPEKSGAAPERRGSSGQRPLSCKEKLREGLSQPVKSDKAVKMMQSMGWTGGALGLRGDGITEPIMPSIDLAKRAGLGHVPPPKKVVPKKSKTKAVKPQEPSNNSTEPFDVVPVEAIPLNQLPPGILPTGSERDNSSKIVYLTSNYHVLVLTSTLELVTTQLEKIYFIFSAQKRAQKACNFILEVVKTLNNRARMTLSDKLQIDLIHETMEYFVHNNPLRLVADPKKGTIIMRKKGHKPFLKIPETKTTESRQWYPKTFELCENVETTDLKHNEKLLAAILKPLQQKTTDQLKVETTNQLEPIEVGTTNQTEPIKVVTTKHSEPIEVGTTQHSEPIEVESSESVIVKTTIQTKPFEMETTVQQELTDYQMQSQTLSPGCLPSLKSGFEISNVTTETDTLTSQVAKILKTPRWVDIMSSETPEESEGSNVDIDKLPILTELQVQQIIERMRNERIQIPQEVKTNTQNLKAKRKNKTKKESIESWEMYRLSDSEKLSVKQLRKKRKKINKKLKKMRKADKEIQQILTHSDEIKSRIAEKEEISKRIANQQKKTTITTDQQQQEIPVTIAKQLEMSTTIAQQQEIPVTIAQQLEMSTTMPKQQEQPTIIAKQQKMSTATTKQQQQKIPVKIAKQLEMSTTTPKQQEVSTETVETTKSHNSQLIQGYLKLEKHPINNNYTIGNKNISNTTATSNKENIIANNPVIAPIQNNAKTAQKESLNVNTKSGKNENMTITINNASENDKHIVIVKDLQESDDINKINNQLLTIDLSCDTTIENKTNGDIGVEIANNTKKATTKTEENTKNDVNTDTYNAEETEMTIKSDNTLPDTACNIHNSDNDTDYNSNEESAIELNTNTKTDKDSLLDYESDDCKIITQDNSGDTIKLYSNDEDTLLLSDNETESSETATVTVRKVFERMTCDLKDALKETENAKDELENAIEASKATLNTEKEGFDPTQNRKRTSLDSPNVNKKRHKSLTDFKKLCIMPLNYPQTKINNEKASEIQASILSAIDNTNQLPLLSCAGIQNGGLVYNCQDEKSLFFMENLIKAMEDLTIVYEFDVEEKLCHKIAFRINSFVEEPVNKILSRLELYNIGLNSTKWGFIKKEQYGDFAVIYVEIDDISFDYVRKADYVLYAGNDCARFTIVWD